MLKAIKEFRENRKLFKLLSEEVEKQGLLVMASRLTTAEEQREFISKYWELKQNTKLRWF
ncbi:hypothetical protein [Niallia sp. FSL W8-1348]|uniref:hypothetical protein n=1 Tax=Niallia sp. FSL W8-1348 TaxID=2954656 RepID=UPI0002E9CDB4